MKPEMYFNHRGLVTDDQGDQVLYIPWKHIHGLWRHTVQKVKPFQTYPAYRFTREQVGFILCYYIEELSREN